MIDFLGLILVQGSFVTTVLAAGWFASGVARQREIQRIKTHRACKSATLNCGVSLVLPVKGVREYSLSNWTSHLCLQYDGPVEYLFVTDTEHDECVPVIRQLLCQCGDDVNARLIISGPATHCSQKIHNLVCGIRSSSASSKYLLCLDDDVALHPGCVTHLVQLLESRADMFMATGYPFDIPSRGSNLAAYCCLVYHLPLLIAFSVAQVTSFVWGGFMLLRRDELLPYDRYGLLQSWCGGGYSDDLVAAAVCSAHGLKIACPGYAIFPQRLPSSPSWKQYINYLHRQLYVLDTYSSSHNKLLNHTMMAVHTWASAAWATALVASSCMLFRKWCTLGWPLLSYHLHLDRHPDGHLPGQGQGRSAAGPGHHSCNNQLLFMFICTCVLAQAALAFMTGRVRRLLNLQHHSRELRAHFVPYNYFKLWAGLFIQCCMSPLLIVYVLLCHEVTWSGITYCKAKGKVRRTTSHHLDQHRHEQPPLQAAIATSFPADNCICSISCDPVSK